MEHSFSAPPLRSSNDGASVSLPGGTFEPGDMVQMAYNLLPNSDFLATYGFHDAETPNPYDTLTIYTYTGMKRSEYAERKQHPCSQLVKVTSKQWGHVPRHLSQLAFQITQQGIDKGAFPDELLLCAAAASMPGRARSLNSWSDLTSEIKAKAKAALAAALEAMLRSMETTVDDDITQLEDGATGRSKTAIQYRLTRKKLLNSAVSALGGSDGKKAPRLHLTSMQDLSKVKAEAAVVLAQWHDVLGEKQQAEKAWQEALSLDPTRVDVQSAMGLLFMAHAQPGQAREHFRRALDMISYEADKTAWAKAACNLADATASLGEAFSSMQLYKEALKADSSLESCQHNMNQAQASLTQAEAEMTRNDALSSTKSANIGAAEEAGPAAAPPTKEL